MERPVAWEAAGMGAAARAAGARGAALVARAAPARLARATRVQGTDYGEAGLAAVDSENRHSRVLRST